MTSRNKREGYYDGRVPHSEYCERTDSFRSIGRHHRRCKYGGLKKTTVWNLLYGAPPLVKLIPRVTCNGVELKPWFDDPMPTLQNVRADPTDPTRMLADLDLAGCLADQIETVAAWYNVPVHRLLGYRSEAEMSMNMVPAVAEGSEIDRIASQYSTMQREDEFRARLLQHKDD